MNKRLTKVLSLILTLVMFLSVTTPAFAWGGGELGGGWDREIGEGDVREFGDYDPAAEEKEEMDLFQTFDEENHIQVTVEAPMGSLPSLAEIHTELVPVEDVREAVNEAVEGEPEILLALDISFWLGEDEIEPEKPVRVKITANELQGKTGITVVHIPDDAEPETVQLIPSDEELGFEVGANEVAFRAESFSVYAVVSHDDPDENARLLVRFFHHDDDADPAYQVYVTQRDVDILGTIIEDPEIPATEGNELFCGWYVGGTNYTDADVDGQHTIDYVRGEVRDYLLENDITEGAVLDVYAMVFHYFNVYYVDENAETTLDTMVFYSKEESVSMTVQLEYSPQLAGYRFFGWQKDDGDETIYQNGQTTTITEKDTSIRAQVQRGYWLSFEENPANHYKGATYNAPVFCVDGVIPASAKPADPKLSGYTFGGWYENFTAGSLAENDQWTGSQFSFSGTIDQDTTVYAKWTLNATVPYTIVVWRQNVNDAKDAADSAKTYDYAFAVSGQAAPNSATSAIDVSAYTGFDGQKTTQGGKEYDFLGFKHLTVKYSDTTVKPNGTTVINIYYDRELVTLNFWKPTYSSASWNSNAARYVLVNGKHIPVNFVSNNYAYYRVYPADLNTSNTYYILYDNTVYSISYSNGAWRSGGTVINPENWNIYSRTYNPGYYSVSRSVYKTFTGLYGSTLEQNGYTWPNEYDWYAEGGQTGFGTGTRTTFLADFIPASTNMTVEFYGEDSRGSVHVHFYTQDLDGTNYTEKNSVPTSGGTFYLSDKFNGFTCYSYSLTSATAGFTRVGEKMKPSADSTDLYYDADPSTDEYDSLDYSSDLYIRFNRNRYSIIYSYGVFRDGNDSANVAVSFIGPMKEYPEIFYEMPLDAYAEDGSLWYEPDAEGLDQFYFAGWYSNPECTVPYDFSGKTMPVDGVLVYAKFIQRQYRVFLHPNLDETITWNEASQPMDFRVNYLDKISNGTPISGRSDNYVLVGWYTDEACTQVFNFDTRLDDTLATPYDGSAGDSDRPWVDGRVDLYAKWRKVLPGANGVTVVYNAIETNETGHTGTFATEGGATLWTDPMRYADKTSAMARPASTPDLPDDWQFLYWQLLDNEGNPVEGQEIYPGQLFDVDAQYAVETEVSPNPSVLNALRQVGPLNPLGDTKTVYAPVDSIEVGEEYLIGIVNNGTTYLLMNYSPNHTNAYYFNDNYTYFAYGIPAVLEDGNVVDLDNTSYGDATFSHVTWKFVKSGNYYRIQSGYQSSYYLRIFGSSSYYDCYPASNPNANVSSYWSYSNHDLSFLYSSTFTSLTKHVYLAPVDGESYAFFGAGSTAGTVQLFKKTEIDLTPTYTVTFQDWDGTVLKTETVEQGQSATAPADPVRTDYTFTGWDKDFSEVTEDLVVTATYVFSKEGYFIVTFKDWNGTVLKSEEVAEGESATAPADPTREGFTFKGWDKDFSEIHSNLVVNAMYSSTITKVYTVTLRAVYGPRYQQELTHITWYANNGTGSYMESIGVKINDNIPIPVPASDWASSAKSDKYIAWESNNVAGDEGALFYEDHVFLGWARVNESDMDGNVYWNSSDDHPDLIELGYDDLFLRYDPDSKIYTANNNVAGVLRAAESEDDWFEADFVAADELMPYHAMYAVWGKVFYVYHSGTNVVERIIIPENNIATVDGVPAHVPATVDLASRTSDGFLYGGYYSAYAGMSEGFNAKSSELQWASVSVEAAAAISDEAQAEAQKGWLFTGSDEDGTPYTAANISSLTWDGAQAYGTGENDADGMHVVPQAGMTYYIKEVPEELYLRPYFHYTYHKDTNVISSGWLISDTDDTNYIETGFAIVNANGEAEPLVSSLTVKTQSGNNTIKLTAKRVFGAPGYLSYLEVMKGQEIVPPQEGQTLNVFGNNNSIVQYWQTPDGLFVTSAVARTFSGVTSGNTVRTDVEASNANAESQILVEISDYRVD